MLFGFHPLTYFSLTHSSAFCFLTKAMLLIWFRQTSNFLTYYSGHVWENMRFLFHIFHHFKCYCSRPPFSPYMKMSQKVRGYHFLRLVAMVTSKTICNNQWEKARCPFFQKGHISSETKGSAYELITYPQFFHGQVQRNNMWAFSKYYCRFVQRRDFMRSPDFSSRLIGAHSWSSVMWLTEMVH